MYDYNALIKILISGRPVEEREEIREEGGRKGLTLGNKMEQIFMCTYEICQNEPYNSV